jgi:hypothetical protein
MSMPLVGKVVGRRKVNHLRTDNSKKAPGGTSSQPGRVVLPGDHALPAVPAPAARAPLAENLSSGSAATLRRSSLTSPR